jgi:Holliday junction resolvase YEN1
MREAGRDVLGTSVPAWSLDQTDSDALPSRAAQTLHRQLESTPPDVSRTATRGVHAGLIGRGPVDLPDWSRSLPPAAHLPKPATSSSGSGIKDHVQAITTPSANEIRAARLRHFETSSPRPLQNTNDQPLLPLAPMTNKRPAADYHVPVGVECIDLTDD